METYTHDLAIVGAGPAGAATAFFLAQRGFDVALIDKAEFPRDKTCGDALSPRALHIIEAMGLLETLRAQSSTINYLDFYTPDHQLCRATVPYLASHPPYTLIAPRYQLDHLLQQRAVQAGATFFNFEVIHAIKEDGRIVGVSGREHTIRAKLIVAATGAATPFLKQLGLLQRNPVLMVAARQYFENLPPLTDTIDFYFDHIPLPGYGWMFPTSPTTANIGVGYFGKKHSSPRTLLENFYQAHPRLRTLLQNAKPTSPLKGYPLRVDFHESTLMVDGALGVGEAVGLVNPFTGEGIDYALESGWLAADCIAAAGGFTMNHLSSYPRRLRAQFQRYFQLITLMRNVFYNEFMLNRLFGRGAHSAFVRETIMEICIAEGDPMRAFSPKILWEVLKP